MAKTKKLFGALTRRGPHRVLRGDLGFAGLPGTVYTPESGLNLPGVAFGHDWLQGVGRYNGTLEHLASWGIVAAAPNTETGIAPSVLNLAFDLGTTLDIITGVRLGPGKISVHPTKLGLVGHGFGASAAIFTAAGLGSSANPPKAVAAVFPTASKPDADQPAAGLRVPGLILNAPGAELTIQSNATELATAWRTATGRTGAAPPPFQPRTRAVAATIARSIGSATRSQGTKPTRIPASAESCPIATRFGGEPTGVPTPPTDAP